MSYITTNLQSLRVAAGMSISRLASLANMGDLTVRALEDNALPRHADRPQFKVSRRDVDSLANILGTDLAGLGAVDVDIN